MVSVLVVASEEVDCSCFMSSNEITLVWGLLRLAPIIITPYVAIYYTHDVKKVVLHK